jgi:hypothetical protein
MDATGIARAEAHGSGAGPQRRAPRRRARTAIAIGVLGVAVMTAGCAKSNDTSASTAKAPTPDAASAAKDQRGVPGNAPTAQNADPASLNTNAVDQPTAEAGRSVISSATVTVKVEDVGIAKDKAAGAAEKAGGFLFAEQTTFGEKSQATMTLKVPPPAFRALLDELGHLGVLAAEEVKSDDVTQQVIDIQARITATEASLGRTRDLLGGAKSIAEVTQLENEVVRRQADLESLRGQQKTLQAKVDMATIVLTLSGDKDATPAVQQQREEAERKRQEEERKKNEAKPLPGFFDGLSGGLSVAASVGTVCLAVIGALLPFLPLAILAYVVLRITTRARRRRDAAPGAAAAEPGSAPTG